MKNTSKILPLSLMVGKCLRLLRVGHADCFLVGFLGLPLLRHLPRGRLETRRGKNKSEYYE